MCTPKPVAPNLCRRKHPGTHPTMRGRSRLHWGCLGKGGELDWFRWTGQLQGEACKAQCSAAEGICFLLYSEGGTSVTDSGLGTISLGDNRPGRAHGRRRRRRDAGDGAGGARCGGVGGAGATWGRDSRGSVRAGESRAPRRGTRASVLWACGACCPSMPGRAWTPCLASPLPPGEKPGRQERQEDGTGAWAGPARSGAPGALSPHLRGRRQHRPGE